MINIYSWNVNGIRAVQKKGLLDWMHEVNPDILCLQETKAHPEQLDEALTNPEGYHVYWSSAERKGYSGVGVYSRPKPASVDLGLGTEIFDREGRTIIADYGDFVLINAYFPNGSRDHSRVPYKMDYKAEFLEVCNRTGFLPIERAWIDRVVEEGYLDTFRLLHPEQEDAYTWWAYWGKARERNVGWRIDYFFISPGLRERVVAAEIHPQVMGSDHCPVSLTLAT